MVQVRRLLLRTEPYLGQESQAHREEARSFLLWGQGGAEIQASRALHQHVHAQHVKTNECMQRSTVQSRCLDPAERDAISLHALWGAQQCVCPM